MNSSPYRAAFNQMAKEVKAQGALACICVFLTPGEDTEGRHKAKIHIDFAGDSQFTHEHVARTLAAAAYIVTGTEPPIRERFNPHDA